MEIVPAILMEISLWITLWFPAGVSSRILLKNHSNDNLSIIYYQELSNIFLKILPGIPLKNSHHNFHQGFFFGNSYSGCFQNSTRDSSRNFTNNYLRNFHFDCFRNLSINICTHKQLRLLEKFSEGFYGANQCTDARDYSEIWSEVVSRNFPKKSPKFFLQKIQIYYF